MKSLIIKLALLASILSGLLFVPLSIASAATPIDCTSPTSAKDQIQCGACDAAGNSANCTPTDSSKTLSDTIAEVINILSLIAGAVAVVMIIIGGFRYVTSAGNAEGTKAARNTITYAIIGLVVVALAQIIVHFVLNSVTSPNASATSGTSSTTTGTTTPTQGSHGKLP